MANIATLRADIKNWEHDFREEQGRVPSVQDIRDNPAIADKYKLYKRLNKPAASSSSSANTQLQNDPSTPPRSQSHQAGASFIISKGRAVHVIAPTYSSNPFSPVKNKGKQRDTRVSEGELQANPFATPTKGKPRRPKLPADALCSIQPLQPTALASSQYQSQNHAVNRARKRLRGDPVSPSPVKEKRQRMGSQALLPFKKMTIDSSDEEEGYDIAGEGNSSFVDDSPVKASTNGKDFKLLFDEAPSQSGGKMKTHGRPKTASTNSGLFRGRKDGTTGASVFGGNASSSNSKSVSAGINGKGSTETRAKVVTERPAMLRGLVPGKDTLWAAAAPLDRTQLSMQSRPAAKAEPPESRSRASKKRSLADSELDTGDVADDVPDTSQGVEALLLIPPSPPPEGQSKSYKGKGKGKGKAASRKKAKVLEELGDDEENSSEEADVRVKVSDWSWNRPRTQPLSQNAEDLDLQDPLLSLASHRAGNELPALDSLVAEDSGKFEVNLPDHLRCMLSISPTRARDSKEEKLVRGLLYRERTTHYDPTKGGEIWDVGEEEEQSKGSTEGEDDWEGEPIPWEMGEL